MLRRIFNIGIIIFLVFILFLVFEAVAREISKTVNVIYFFPRDGYENGSGNPNWYYYWSRTSASSGSHQYNSTLVYDGQYTFGDNYFEIGASARLQDAGYYSGGGDGIDNFGSSCFHEKAHMDYYFTYWHPIGGYDKSKDKDKDLLRDDTEAMLGYNPNLKGTPGNTHCKIDDFEDYACHAEAKWVIGSANKQDWAAPGKRYNGGG